MAKSTEEVDSVMPNQATQEVTLAKSSLNLRCTAKANMAEAATVATADTAVVAADSEIAATRAEAKVVATETAVANVTEVVVIEATAAVAVEVTRVGLKFPMFPKVKLQLCCPTISGSRQSRIKALSTSTRLNSEFSIMPRKLDSRLCKVLEPN